MSTPASVGNAAGDPPDSASPDAIDLAPLDYAPPPPRHDPYAALRLREFRLYAVGNVAGTLGMQMVAVGIGFELYERTNSATALGLVGLVQVIPVLLLSLPAGHLVDQYDRRRTLLASQLALVASVLALGLASLFHDRVPDWEALRAVNGACAAIARLFGETGCRFADPYVPLMFGLIFANGVVRSLNQPAKSAFLPLLVPPALFGNAVTWNSSLFEVCSMVGPAIGGFLIAACLKGPAAAVPWAYPSVYLTSAALQVVLFVALLPIRPVVPPRPREPITWSAVLAGVRYVWSTKIIFGTLTLDLFAVILGGAVALLPIYAKDILHVGPVGLGWLRAAPSVGAFAMATALAHLPPMKRAGRNLLWCVGGFGVATVVFGLSTSFWLSLVMLALTGMFDNVSVVVRQTLVQTLTPDAMRGRVSAVNAIFIGSSNQLGSLESGLTAAAFGAVRSVVLGGVGTILVVLAAAAAWPELRRFKELHRHT